MNYSEADTFIIHLKNNRDIDLEYKTLDNLSNKTVFTVYAFLPIKEHKSCEICGHKIDAIRYGGYIYVPEGALYCNSEIVSNFQPEIYNDWDPYFGMVRSEMRYNLPEGFICDGETKFILKNGKVLGGVSSFLYPFDSYLWQFMYSKEGLNLSKVSVDYDPNLPAIENGQIVYFNQSHIATKIYNLKELFSKAKEFWIEESNGTDSIGLVNIKTEHRGFMGISQLFFYVYIILLLVYTYSIIRKKIIINKLIIVIFPFFVWLLEIALTRLPPGINLFSILAGINCVLGIFSYFYLKKS